MSSTCAAVDTPVAGLSAYADSGLRCPRCDYNLTGLTQPRCPECGAMFDWEQVRRGITEPRVAFERARGLRKPGAFAVTWSTALFAPWLLARQLIARADVLHGLLFALACFIGTAAALLIDCDRPTWCAWVSTAAVYILAQTVLLSLLDPHLRAGPLATLRFWFVAGCYTSAVMVTECVIGPPLMSINELGEWFSGVWGGQAGVFELYEVIDNDPEYVAWLQVLLWMFGVGCCYVARLRARGVSPGAMVPLVLVAMLVVFLLYGTLVEQLGVRFWELYGGRIF